MPRQLALFRGSDWRRETTEAPTISWAICACGGVTPYAVVRVEGNEAQLAHGVRYTVTLDQARSCVPAGCLRLDALAAPRMWGLPPALGNLVEFWF